MNEHMRAGAATPEIAEPTVRILVEDHGGLTIVRIFGDLNLRTAGKVLDHLVACIDDGATKIIVDLTCVYRVTHGGVRGFLVAAQMLRHRCGQFRLCGAFDSVEKFLRGLGFDHLLKFDPTLGASIARLSPSMSFQTISAHGFIPAAMVCGRADIRARMQRRTVEEIADIARTRLR